MRLGNLHQLARDSMPRSSARHVTSCTHLVAAGMAGTASFAMSTTSRATETGRSDPRMGQHRRRLLAKRAISSLCENELLVACCCCCCLWQGLRYHVHSGGVEHHAKTCRQCTHCSAQAAKRGYSAVTSAKQHVVLLAAVTRWLAWLTDGRLKSAAHVKHFCAPSLPLLC